LVAGAALVPEAEVVEVEGAGFAFASGDDESAFAAVAPYGAFEVVVVDAFAGASAACFEYFLDLVEYFDADQGFVAAGVFLAFVDDVAEVVAVAEDVAEFVHRQ
jgi:hypothetical protein